MTQDEIIAAAIVAGSGGLGVAIRWSASIIKGAFGQLTTAIEAATKQSRETHDALQVLAKEHGAFKAHVDVGKKLEEAVERIADEISGVHDAAVPIGAEDEDTGPFGHSTGRTPTSRKTPRGGYPIQRRARSKGV